LFPFHFPQIFKKLCPPTQLDKNSRFGAFAASFAGRPAASPPPIRPSGESKRPEAGVSRNVRRRTHEKSPALFVY
jgi:hypothetical protein